MGLVLAGELRKELSALKDHLPLSFGGRGDGHAWSREVTAVLAQAAAGSSPAAGSSRASSRASPSISSASDETSDCLPHQALVRHARAPEPRPRSRARRCAHETRRSALSVRTKLGLRILRGMPALRTRCMRTRCMRTRCMRTLRKRTRRMRTRWPSCVGPSRAITSCR